ncbi:hypothetical protein AFK24_26795 [Pseudomonas syringae]|uniref:Solute-binding protein family 5 domain-containing protein n=1 Tax=Pseudomonas syringae TaxID=317 RepID=A0A1C7YX23_PSESX|nr:ABC transporter substrate-binding protein [Pseudomonas syringae]OCR22053.1 hypothetical protein AFK24_26795 [Pseudomonas syringae]
MLERRALLRGTLQGLALAALPRAILAESRGTPDELSIAYPTDINGWDPLGVNPLQSALIKCLFDQPLTVDDQLRYGPSVVTYHRWLDTHCRTLELCLRDGIRFHNGDRLTTRDLRFSFVDRARQAPGSLLAGVWSGIEEIEILSEQKAIIHLRYPMAFAPAMLADVPSYLVPADYYQTVGSSGFAKAPVGSGPYRLVEYRQGERVVLEANLDYWRGPPPIRRLVFLISRDAIARAAMLQAGKAGLTMNLSVRETRRLGNLPGLAQSIRPSTAIVLLQMVNQGALRNRDVRLALHHALDKPAISSGLFGGCAVPIWVPAGPDMPGHVEGFRIDHDPERARQLLAGAGHGPQRPLQLNLYTTKGALPADLEMAQAVQYMWQAIGIEVHLKVLSPSLLIAYQNQGRLDGPVLRGWNPAAGDPATYSGFLMHPAMSFALFKSDDIAARLDPLMAEPNDEIRFAGFRNFDRWQVEQGYSIPLFQSPATFVYRDDLHFTAHPSGLLFPTALGWCHD